MEATGSPLFASTDVDDEVHRGAILLMGFTRPCYLQIPLSSDDSSNRWSASPTTAADCTLPAPCDGDDGNPSTSSVTWRSGDFPDWGRRRKRSRTTAAVGIHEGADARSWSEKKVMRRTSPQSPLDGYSSASGSGSEEGTRWRSPAMKLSRSSFAGVATFSVPPAIVKTPCAAAAAFPGDVSQFPTEMEMGERRAQASSSRGTSPTRGSAPGPIARLTAKKLKKVELKAQEKLLLEERAKIQQELKEIGTAVEVVKAERRELELRLKSPKMETKAAEMELGQLPGLRQDTGSSQMFNIVSFKSKLTNHIELPDLNDPLPVFLD